MSLSQLNFRDVGDIPTRSGQRVRTGVLYRSEGPRNLGPAQRAELDRLDIKAIFDLRSAVERDADPHAWQGEACSVLHLDIGHDLRAGGAIEWDRLRNTPDATTAQDIMIQNYLAIPEALLAHWAPAFGAMLDGRVPALINCTAGKDRTGVAVALILELLGVERDAIVADYLRSTIFGDNMKATGQIEEGFRENLGFVPNEAVIDALVGVHRAYLETAFDSLDRGWDGIDAYFEAGGIDVAQREAVRMLFLHPAEQTA